MQWVFLLAPFKRSRAEERRGTNDVQSSRVASSNSGRVTATGPKYIARGEEEKDIGAPSNPAQSTGRAHEVARRKKDLGA